MDSTSQKTALQRLQNVEKRTVTILELAGGVMDELANPSGPRKDLVNNHCSEFMKLIQKLRGNKSTVHPSPSPLPDKLSFLPAAILSLMIALSPEEKEVLAYLISSPAIPNSSDHRKTTHKPAVAGYQRPFFNCDCFECYMSYWAKWDSSPNRQLIHEIIDAFEAGLARKNNTEKKRRKRRGAESGELKRTESKSELGESNSVERSGGGDGGGGGDEGYEKSSVRKFVSFLGERFWSIWTA